MRNVKPVWHPCRSRSRSPELVRGRELMLVLGVERYGLRVRALATALGKSPEGMSDALARGIRHRVEDGEFRAEVDRLDRALAETLA